MAIAMKGPAFFFLALFLAAVDILVPYFWLAERPSFAASYLYWCALTLAVIVWAAIHTRKWGNRP
jgi:hypothetical protein